MTTVMSDSGLLERLAVQEAELARLRAEVAAWKASVARLPVRDDATFETLSGVAVEPVYTPLDANGSEPLPGEYPYTRGIHPGDEPPIKRAVAAQHRRPARIVGHAIGGAHTPSL